MLEAHLTQPTTDAGPDALVFLTPGGHAVRHTLFMRRVFKPAIIGDPDNPDPRRRRKPALPADKQALRFHDLRHTAASLLIAVGTPPLYVKERLGHSSIATTMNLYGHAFPSMDASVADSLDAMYEASEGQDEGQSDTPTPLRPGGPGQTADQTSAL
jgi:integrase